jgi:hypothetical protein
MSGKKEYRGLQLLRSYSKAANLELPIFFLGLRFADCRPLSVAARRVK